MKFLIQWNGMSDYKLQKIKAEMKDLPVEWIEIKPFTNEIILNEGQVISGLDYIPYGSTRLTDSTSRAEDRFRGIHFDVDIFNYENFIRNRDDMLNHNIYTCSQAIDFLRSQDDDKQFFMKPSNDLKQFAGMLFTAKEAADFLFDACECESPGTYGMLYGDKVVIDEPVEIYAEWRYFIIDGKIVDGSMYKAHGQLRKLHETDKAVLDEAQSFADKWLPDRNCVMDLGLTDDGVKVVEFNGINSSGFYDHDVYKIMKAWLESYD